VSLPHAQVAQNISMLNLMADSSALEHFRLIPAHTRRR
jgi:hypothetical protein